MQIPINPTLPENFDCTPNDARPPEHMGWWGRPYIETDDGRPFADEHGRRQWLRSWPDGMRYDVYCLDGGAWDRPTCKGMFATLSEAIACAEGVAGRHYSDDAPGMGEFYEHFMS